MARKKHAKRPQKWKLPVAAPNTTHPLVAALGLYPVLETLVSFISPFDLAALSQVSQTVYGRIRIYDTKVKANLLTKTLCPGHGKTMRREIYCACAAKTFHQAIRCANDGFETESRPCVECGVNTCNECRIHVFYNYLTEDLGFDKRRWWAGYFFLQPLTIAVYPPKKGNVEAWYKPVEEIEPLHDQGRFHIPLIVPAIGDPEPIDRILDLDLGKRLLITPLGRIEPPYNGTEIVSQLNGIITARKDLVCPCCFEERQGKDPYQCTCTLRKRFVDRWLCIGCYAEEEGEDREMISHIAIPNGNGGHSHQCDCGTDFNASIQPKVLCDWCGGEVTSGLDDMDEETKDEDAEDAEVTDGDEEQQEDHSVGDFLGTTVDEPGFAKNRDGSLSVYVHDTHARGERLSRAMINLWRVEEGMPVECMCCVCGNGDMLHMHGSEDSEDDEFGEDSEEWEAEGAGDGDGDGDEYDNYDEDEDMDMDTSESE